MARAPRRHLEKQWMGVKTVPQMKEISTTITITCLSFGCLQWVYFKFDNSEQKTSTSGKYKDAHLMSHSALCILVYALQSQGHRQDHMIGIDGGQWGLFAIRLSGLFNMFRNLLQPQAACDLAHNKPRLATLLCSSLLSGNPFVFSTGYVIEKIIGCKLSYVSVGWVVREVKPLLCLEGQSYQFDPQWPCGEI